MQSHGGRLCQDRPQLLGEGAATTHEDAGARGDPELAERLDLGGRRHDRGVCRQQDEPRIVRAEHASGDADPEKGRSALRQHFERPGQPIDERGSEPADLAHQAEQLRTAGGKTKDCANHGVEAFPLPFRARQAGIDRLGELTGDDQEHRIEQSVLGPEVVQERLLGAAGGGGHRIERRGPDASRGEGGQGGLEDSHGCGVARKNPGPGEVSGRH